MPNKATREFKAWAAKFFEGAAYRESAKRRILKGRAPALETYALQLLYGRPVERHEIGGGDGVPVVTQVIHVHEVEPPRGGRPMPDRLAPKVINR